MNCRLILALSLIGTAIAVCPNDLPGLELWSDPQTWDTGLVNISHRAPVVLSFSACVSHAISLEKSYGSQINRKSCFENLWSGAFWDRGPSDLKGVPWDQNFGSKNFLIWSYNDAILCVLLICYAKIWVLCPKQLILGCFGHNIGKWAKWTVFGIKLKFWQNKSTKHIK